MNNEYRNELGYIVVKRQNGCERYSTLEEAENVAEKYITQEDVPEGYCIAKIVEIIRVVKAVERIKGRRK